MGKTYRSDEDDYNSSYVKFSKKKIKTNKIKNFLDKSGDSSKYEYLEKSQKMNNSED